MLGIKMDFTVEVTKWVEGVEKIWETVGSAKMIIYSWYRMNLMVARIEKDKSHVQLSITYRRPVNWLARIISYLFADSYCRWCLKRMLFDTKKKLERDYADPNI